MKTTLEPSEEEAKVHSKRVEKTQNYTRNEWRRWYLVFFQYGFEFRIYLFRFVFSWNSTVVQQLSNTLETSGEDAKLHSKRVEKM
jgi:hypothetical protein